MLPSLPQRRGLRRLPSIGSIVLALAVPAIAAGEPPPVFECGWEYCCNTYPVAITVGRGGNVCVATKWFTHGDVNEYGGECGFVAYLGTFDRTPSGVAVEDSGFVYVASQQCNCVLKLSDPIVVWVDTGSAPGKFDGLHGIAIDNEGCVYAADRRNHRVQKLLRDGTPIASFGDYGTGPGQLAEPYAVAVDRAGHFYVTDVQNKRVQKYTTAGAFVTEWGAPGSEPGQFDQPSGITADGRGGVFVADFGNARVQKFSDTGEFLTSWTFPDSSLMLDVAADGQGGIYVVDPFRQVAKFREAPRSAVGDSPRSSLALEAPVPNPFRDRLAIGWSQPAAGVAEISMVDVGGRRIATLTSGSWPAGRHQATWSGNKVGSQQLPAGLYWLRVRSQGREASRPVIRIP